LLEVADGHVPEPAGGRKRGEVGTVAGGGYQGPAGGGAEAGQRRQGCGGVGQLEVGPAAVVLVLGGDAVLGAGDQVLPDLGVVEDPGLPDVLGNAGLDGFDQLLDVAAGDFQILVLEVLVPVEPAFLHPLEQLIPGFLGYLGPLGAAGGQDDLNAAAGRGP